LKQTTQLDIYVHFQQYRAAPSTFSQKRGKRSEAGMSAMLQSDGSFNLTMEVRIK